MASSGEVRRAPLSDLVPARRRRPRSVFPTPAPVPLHPFHSVPSFLSDPGPAWSFPPRPCRRPALVFPVPALNSASRILSHPDPGLAPSCPPGLRSGLRRHKLCPRSGVQAFPSPAFLTARVLPRLPAPFPGSCRPHRHFPRAPTDSPLPPTASHPILSLLSAQY